MSQRKVYLDTNILSRVADLKLSGRAARAYPMLAENGEVVLLTSSETKRELARTPEPVRNDVLRFLCALIEKVPDRIGEVSAVIGRARYGTTMYGGGLVDPRLEGLRAIFEPEDAKHIFLAASAGCDYFLTLDEKTILSRARARAAEVVRLCGSMRLASPEEIMDLLEAGTL